MLFATLDSTVSACSTSVCSQTCGQKPLSEHPRDRGQKAVFIVCRSAADGCFVAPVCRIVPLLERLSKSFMQGQAAQNLHRYSDSEKHIGLRNSYRRLYFMFNHRLSFSINSTEHAGTEIMVTIEHRYWPALSFELPEWLIRNEVRSASPCRVHNHRQKRSRWSAIGRGSTLTGWSLCLYF